MNANAPWIPLKVLKILWFSLLGAQFFYLFVLFQLNRATPVSWGEAQYFPNLSDVLDLSASVAAVVALAASFLIPTALARSAERTNSKKANPEETPPFDMVANRFLLPFFLWLFLVEFVCMAGFGLAMVRNSPQLFLPFLTVSVILYLTRFPADSRKVEKTLLGSSAK